MHRMYRTLCETQLKVKFFFSVFPQNQQRFLSYQNILPGGSLWAWCLYSTCSCCKHAFTVSYRCLCSIQLFLLLDCFSKCHNCKYRMHSKHQVCSALKLGFVVVCIELFINSVCPVKLDFFICNQAEIKKKIVLGFLECRLWWEKLLFYFLLNKTHQQDWLNHIRWLYVLTRIQIRQKILGG